jgi:multiple sugar transport system substrate-binding protein
MRLPVLTSRIALAAAASAAMLLPGSAFATDISMWVRASGANAAQHLIDLWNASHDDKINVTVIPDTQMVTKLATGSQAGDVPDMVSFDLIYMPDFMKAGILKDITEEMKADPNYASVAQAYKDIATYDGKIYGAGFTPDVSILMWNKDLFKQAGLDPDKAPQTLAEIHEDAKKIRALGDNIYGYYFAGSCQGCNIFVTSPMMVASGAKLLPTKPGDKALQGDAIPAVLNEMHQMWAEGLIPESAQADTGANFVANFMNGNIGIQGAGGFLISDLKKNKPDMNFGVGFIPGLKAGDASAFVGGDVIAIPAASKNADLALKFIHWELTDEAQLEGLAKNAIIPSRPSLADNKYFKDEPRVVTTAKALGIGFTPYALHFNDMVNSDSSPWLQMLQTAIFDGDVDGAIKTAQDAMEQIANQ